MSLLVLLSLLAPADVAPGAREVPLPAPVAEVCPAAAGRFLVLHLPQFRQLAVFDVPAGKVVKYVPAASSPRPLAPTPAGARRCKRSVSRWAGRRNRRTDGRAIPPIRRCHETVP